MKKLLLIFLLFTSAQAQFTPEEMLKPFVYTDVNGKNWPYRLSTPQFPEANRRYPLILFLHGSGERGDDNLKQIKVGLPALIKTLLKQPDPVILLAPQCPRNSGWTQTLAHTPEYSASPQATPALQAALLLCHQLVAHGQADPNRLYITGLSLGGFGTWDAIQREPKLFAAAIPICGGGDIRKIEPIKKLPLWIFHGTDDKSVAVDCSQRMYTALKQAGSRSVKFTEYPKAAHNVWDRTYADPKVLAWLLNQTQVKKPWWNFW